MNATALHPTHRQPTFTTGGSPWIGTPTDPRNTSADAAEVQKWRANFEQSRDALAVDNARLGTNVTIGSVIFDVEVYGWVPYYVGTVNQAIIDAVGRKHELVYNVTKQTLPYAEASLLLPSVLPARVLP